MKDRVQLNTRITKPLREKVQADSDRSGPKITRDVVVSAILSDFFKSWTLSERKAFYTRHLTNL